MHDLACVVHLHSTYSDGTSTVRQITRPTRPGQLVADELHDIVLRTFAIVTGEGGRRSLEILRFLLAPARALGPPPAQNTRAGGGLGGTRRVAAIGGLAAHQYGKRIGPV